MGKRCMKKLAVSASGAAMLLLASQPVWAFTIGVAALDSLIQQWETGIPAAGLVVFAIGLIGMALSRLQNQYGQWFDGVFPFFMTAGILGGGTTIASTLGIVGGAVLPI